jgi:flavorubredoxin
MATTVLFDQGEHRNVWLDEQADGTAVPANQHLIVHGKSGVILDPGGHKVYSQVLSATHQALRSGSLEHILLSHQDPDIVAALNGWLMTTDATAWVSALWTRFVPHFGVERFVLSRLKPIPDEGMWLKFADGAAELLVLPAHFFHSPGNFQVYDPVSKILYSGDLGASVDDPGPYVTDWDVHVAKMRGFHKRYMASQRVGAAWAKNVRTLDIEIVAPQHGPAFKGKELVNKFIDWVESEPCGVDFIDDLYKMPTRGTHG